MKSNTITLIIVVLAIIFAIGIIEYNQSKSTTIYPAGGQTKTPSGSGANANVANSANAAPEFAGIAGWINSAPIKMSDLRGKVLLVDFWTYSCINCLRTLPHVVEWNAKYKDQGLVIIGIHTPEFTFEKDYNNVAQAVKEHNITYAVALDNDYGTWNAFQNSYWPRKYLIDAEGNIRYDHIGEGGYDETEIEIQKLLSEASGKNVATQLSNMHDTTPSMPDSPEIYAGYQFALPRGEDIGNSGGMKPDEKTNYALPSGSLDSDKIYLEGEWLSRTDDIMKTGAANSALYLKFHANSANIVASALSLQKNMTQNITLDAYLDGKPFTKDNAGSDVMIIDGKSELVVNEPRLYNVYSGGYGTHTLKLVGHDQGFLFNSFTFG